MAFPARTSEARRCDRAGTKREIRPLETRHPGPDGRDHIIDFSLKPVIGGAGHVDMLIPEGRDITELKATEDALRLSRPAFQAPSGPAWTTSRSATSIPAC